MSNDLFENDTGQGPGEEVNYIKHLNNLNSRFAEDDRLTPYHISLYNALFQVWNGVHFKNPLSIARSEIMPLSKIGSLNTYTRCLKQLNDWEYIRYYPSFNPWKGSQVYMYRFDKGSDKGADKGSSKGSEIVLRPYINILNNKNLINNRYISELLKKSVLSNVIKLQYSSPSAPDNSTTPADPSFKKKEKVAEKRKKLSPEDKIPTAQVGEKVAPKRKKSRPQGEIPTNKSGEAKGGIPDHNPGQPPEDQLPATRQANLDKVPESGTTSKAARKKSSGAFTPPTEQQAEVYFQEKGYTTTEGQKFHCYYSSVGWKVGGTKPMKDWKAAARHWMLNIKNYGYETTQRNNQNQGPGHLHTNKDKDYGEPL